MKDVIVKWHCKRLNKDIHVETWAIPGDNGMFMCDCMDGVEYPYKGKRPRKARICWTTGNDESHVPLLRGFRF